MRTFHAVFLSSALSLAVFFPAPSMAMTGDAVIDGLAPHRAVYDINLIATHSGSQILNISGQMTYEWKPVCGASTTDHHFKLFYEYADSPGMRIASDFATFESQDGKELQYSSRRKRNGDMYQEIRGIADMKGKGGAAVYSKPEGTRYDLSAGTLFPVGHTLELIRAAKAGKKFLNAQVFDGSDEDGPIEINAFVGKTVKPPVFKDDKKIDTSLLKSKAWNVRMAVFPSGDDEEESDYEMTLAFHENGIISDMTIDYDDFSVEQKLVSLEKISAETCDAAPEVPKKP